MYYSTQELQPHKVPIFMKAQQQNSNKFKQNQTPLCITETFCNLYKMLLKYMQKKNFHHTKIYVEWKKKAEIKVERHKNGHKIPFCLCDRKSIKQKLLMQEREFFM